MDSADSIKALYIWTERTEVFQFQLLEVHCIWQSKHYVKMIVLFYTMHNIELMDVKQGNKLKWMNIILRYLQFSFFFVSINIYN